MIHSTIPRNFLLLDKCHVPYHHLFTQHLTPSLERGVKLGLGWRERLGRAQLPPGGTSSARMPFTWVSLIIQKHMNVWGCGDKLMINLFPLGATMWVSQCLKNGLLLVQPGWYQARVSEEKHTGNAPQLASGSLVLSFPGHYSAKGALSLIFTSGNNHEINWERPRKSLNLLMNSNLTCSSTAELFMAHSSGSILSSNIFRTK